MRCQRLLSAIKAIKAIINFNIRKQLAFLRTIRCIKWTSNCIVEKKRNISIIDEHICVPHIFMIMYFDKILFFIINKKKGLSVVSLNWESKGRIFHSMYWNNFMSDIDDNWFLNWLTSSINYWYFFPGKLLKSLKPTRDYQNFCNYHALSNNCM